MVLKSRKFRGRANTITKPSTIIAGRDLRKYFPPEVFHKPKVQLLLLGAIFPTCIHAQKNVFSRDPNLGKLLYVITINVRIDLYIKMPFLKNMSHLNLNMKTSTSLVRTLTFLNG